jgi:hypothetical protein
MMTWLACYSDEACRMVAVVLKAINVPIREDSKEWLLLLRCVFECQLAGYDFSDQYLKTSTALYTQVAL